MTSRHNDPFSSHRLVPQLSSTGDGSGSGKSPLLPTALPPQWNRRRLLVAAVATASVPLLWRPARASDPSGQPALSVNPQYPTEDPSVVREVVGVAHRDLDRLTELVDPHPELANAAWDWGFGDWETALGAASHVGRADIARYLIEKGARPDIFTAAMLGQLDVVKGFLTMSPGIQDRRGPHGIPLLAHARAGGDAAESVLDYLQSLSRSPESERPELSDEELTLYHGNYRFGNSEDEEFQVAPSAMGGIAIQRSGQTARRLTFLGEHSFHPAGAPSVRVRFIVTGDRCSRLEVDSPPLVLSADRTN